VLDASDRPLGAYPDRGLATWSTSAWSCLASTSPVRLRRPWVRTGPPASGGRSCCSPGRQRPFLGPAERRCCSGGNLRGPWSQFTFEEAVDDDRDAVARCLQGDEAAFGELFRRHEARVLRLAYALLGDREAAEDAKQEAFLAAFRSLDRMNADVAFSSWLHRNLVWTARAVSWRAYRRREVARRVESPAHHGPALARGPGTGARPSRQRSLGNGRLLPVGSSGAELTRPAGVDGRHPRIRGSGRRRVRPGEGLAGRISPPGRRRAG